MVMAMIGSPLAALTHPPALAATSAAAAACSAGTSASKHWNTLARASASGRNEIISASSNVLRTRFERKHAFAISAAPSLSPKTNANTTLWGLHSR
jgi:hypothetical protein